MKLLLIVAALALPSTATLAQSYPSPTFAAPTFTNPSQTRTNLGLGGAATLNVGTTAGTVAAGDVPLAKTANLSDLSSAATARVNLGLAGTPTAGGLAYGTSTAQAYTAAGNSGNLMVSSGSAAPAWSSQSSLIGATLSLGFATSLSPGYLNLQSSAGTNGSTTLASGATTSALKIILPAAVGTAGQVLTQTDAGTGGTMTTGWTTLGTLATQSAGSVAITGGTQTGMSKYGLSTSGSASSLEGSGIPYRVQIGPITGAYATNNPNLTRFDCGVDTATVPNGVLGSCVGIFETFGGAGTTGARRALNVGTLLTGAGTSAVGSFAIAGEFRVTADASMGGSYPGTVGGAIDTFSTYAIGTANDGYLSTISTEEANWEQMYGGAAVLTFGKEFARLSQDWGIVASQSNNDFQGRYSLWLTSQQPSVDTASAASVTASAGKNLPGFRSQIAFGGGSQESTFDPTFGSLMFSFPQIYANSNSCTVGVTTNCTVTTGAAAIKPQALWNGFELGNIHFNNEVLRSPGFVVKGTGETDIGVASIVPTSTGLTIDVNGSYVSTATYVSGNLSGQFQVGEYLYGSYTNGTVPGAILMVTSVLTSGGATITVPGTAGTPNGLAVIDPGYSTASAATNNASTTLGTAAKFMGHGTNVISLTWTDVKDSTPGVATVAIAPTNGVVKLGGSTYLTGGTNGAFTVTGTITAGKNVYSGPTSGFVGGTGGILFPNGGSNGQYAGIGINGSALVFKNYAGTIVGSFDMNATTPQFAFNNGASVSGTLTHGVVLDNAIVKVTPTSGTTVTVAQTTHTELLAPAGTLAALTLAFPACNSTYAGQEFRVSSTYAITTLTISISTGGNAGDWPASLTSGQGFAAICNPSDNGWYRLY